MSDQQQRDLAASVAGQDTTKPTAYSRRPWRYAFLFRNPPYPAAGYSASAPLSVWLRFPPGARAPDLTLQVGVARLVDLGITDLTAATIWLADPSGAAYAVDLVTDHDPIGDAAYPAGNTDNNGNLMAQGVGQAFLVNNFPGTALYVRAAGLVDGLSNGFDPSVTIAAHHFPAAGTVASIVLPPAPGQFYTLRQIFATFFNNNLNGADIKYLQVIDGATVIEGGALAIIATYGSVDHMNRSGLMIRGTTGQGMTVAFSGIAAGATTTQSISIGYSLT